MPHYKPINYNQTKLLPIIYSEQLIEGTFEHTLHHLVEDELDLIAFDQRYHNDETGASAYPPNALLKIILYAYSLGITSSRKIAKLCDQHIIFMALSADTRPHFTTIANFIAQLPKEIEDLFLQVLLICEESGLIGRDMFSTDGCKISSNASKEWSGTVEDFEKRKQKMEQVIQTLVLKHRKMDTEKTGEESSEAEEKKLKTLKAKAKKIKTWLKTHGDKIGKSGKPIKSNITDPDSAKMKSSDGVFQGYNGIATVDAKRQVIVNAQAVGSGNENDQLQPMLEGCKDNFRKIGKSENIVKEVAQSADCGFHSASNVLYLEKEKINAYLPDQNFRKRDSRFTKQGSYKENKKEKKLFSKEDFIYSSQDPSCLCPTGKSMRFICKSVTNQGFHTVQFQGFEKDCGPCPLRKKCLKNPNQKTPRQFSVFEGREGATDSAVEKMKKKIDSEEGKRQYSKRLGIVEPVFGNVTSNIGLKRFSHRGLQKVNAQWNLFSIVHNIGKIQKYAA